MRSLLTELPEWAKPCTDDRAFWSRPWHATLDVELERRERLFRWLSQNPSERPFVREIARRDVVFFIGNFGWSYDARDAIRPVQPMVLWAEQRAYAYALACPWVGALLIEKSRDQGASVIAAHVVVQTWGMNEGYDWGLLTRVGKDLDDGTYNSLFGKIDWTLERIPPFIIRPGSYIRRGRPNTTLINRRTGSVVRGGATTGGTLRGYRFRKVFVDEFAHIQGAGRMMPSLQGLTDNLVVASSVNGNANAFADIRFGRAGYLSAPFDPRTLLPPTQSGQAGMRGGWQHMRLHWSQDPRKQGDWASAKRASMSLEDWSQEYDIAYNTSTRYRVLPEMDAAACTYDAAEWADVWLDYGLSARKLVGWDFGSGTSLTAYCAALYFDSTDTLIFFQYQSWQEAHVDDVARDYGEDGWECASNRGGMVPDDLVGDVAGKARGSDQRSWLVNLRDRGVDIAPRMCANLSEWVMLIRRKLREGKILFAPACASRRDTNLPSLVESVSGWRYKLRQDGDPAARGENGPIKVDKSGLESHLADCFVYVCMEVWGQRAAEVKMVPLK